jgi:hypothetical protein
MNILTNQADVNHMYESGGYYENIVELMCDYSHLFDSDFDEHDADDQYTLVNYLSRKNRLIAQPDGSFVVTDFNY